MDDKTYDQSDQLFLRLNSKKHNSNVKSEGKNYKVVNKHVIKVALDRKYVYTDDCKWLLFVDEGEGFITRPSNGRYQTAMITQQVSRDMYEIFNFAHGHSSRAVHKNPNLVLQPTQYVIVNRQGEIVSLLNGIQNESIISDDDKWKIDAIVASLSSGFSEDRLKMELFAWCTAPIQTVINNKANKQLLNTINIHNKPPKVQLKRAQIGLQLILCELKRDFLAQCSGLFRGYSFLNEPVVSGLFSALWSDHIESVHNVVPVFKQLSLEVVLKIFDFISPLVDNNVDHSLSTFTSLLF
jgi:hypothetical protein